MVRRISRDAWSQYEPLLPKYLEVGAQCFQRLFHTKGKSCFKITDGWNALHVTENPRVGAHGLRVKLHSVKDLLLLNGAD